MFVVEFGESSNGSSLSMVGADEPPSRYPFPGKRAPPEVLCLRLKELNQLLNEAHGLPHAHEQP